jgi:hypothetical protein
VILTVGHSTRPQDELVAILEEVGVELAGLAENRGWSSFGLGRSACRVRDRRTRCSPQVVVEATRPGKSKPSRLSHVAPPNLSVRQAQGFANKRATTWPQDAQPSRLKVIVAGADLLPAVSTATTENSLRPLNVPYTIVFVYGNAVVHVFLLSSLRNTRLPEAGAMPSQQAPCRNSNRAMADLGQWIHGVRLLFRVGRDASRKNISGDGPAISIRSLPEAG